jgi:hypothetical protein
MRRSRWLGRGARLLAWLALACGACGDSGGSGDTSCVPGETQVCSGPGACDGAQFCSSDGQGWSACDCAATAAVPALAACSASVGGCEVPNRLGASCEADSDCGQGWLCWSETARDFLGFTGGPAHGYCTLGCRQPEDCQGVDPGAACNVLPGMDQGMCLRGCLSKSPEARERKCLDRPDVTCWSLPALGFEPFSITSRQQGLCQPSCGSDEDCPGHFCDLSLGLCTDRAPSGAAIGAACASDADCASGTCLTPVGGLSYCSAVCRFGMLGCGFAETAPGREAACAAPLLTEGGVAEGAGDAGTCLELCDLSDPCTLPDWQCVLGSGLAGGRGVCQFVGTSATLAASSGATP